MTYAAYKSKLKQIVVLSFFSSGLDVAAFTLVYYLLSNLTGKEIKAFAFFPLVHASLSSPLILIISIAALLSLSIKVRYLTFKLAIDVSMESATYAGKAALVGSRKIIHRDGPESLRPKKIKALLSSLTKDIPFSCGFAARGFVTILTKLIQTGVLFLLLFYMSPILAFLILVISCIFLIFLSRSFEAVIDSNEDRVLNSFDFRQEASDLAHLIVDKSENDENFSTRADAAFTTGSTHRQLSLKLIQRKERQTGSLILEYIYPIAIILISILFLYFGDFAPDITQLAVFLLVTRQALVALSAAGKVFISFSRYHFSLELFMDIMTKEHISERLFQPD